MCGCAPVTHIVGLIVIVAKGTTNLVTVLRSSMVEFQYKYSHCGKISVRIYKAGCNDIFFFSYLMLFMS